MRYIGRVCIQRSSGKLIEFQSGTAALGTLTNNAVVAGFLRDDVDERYITDEEYQTILSSPPNSTNGLRGKILSELRDLDLQRIRPLAENDAETLQALNAKAAELRSVLHSLQNDDN